MKLPKISFLKLKPVQRKGLECLNCGQPLRSDDNFCSYCGQKNSIKKLSFGVFISNLFSGFFSYDSRFWRTFIPLLTKPGKISKEFIQGKRVKYVNPFQLYLNVSIIFFIILGISNKIDDGKTLNNVIKINETIDSLDLKNSKKIDSIVAGIKDEAIKNLPKDSTNQEIVTSLNNALNLINREKAKDTIKEHKYYIQNDAANSVSLSNKLKDYNYFYKKNRNLGTEQALDSLGYEKSFWNKFYYGQVINFYKTKDDFIKNGGRTYKKELISKISIALFVFLPIFTMFAWLIYMRRKFTYMEHLVFVFNTQTVFFLLLSIFYFLNFFVDMNNYGWIFTILFLIYLYKAMRHFYGQNRFKTIVKFILLNSYFIFLANIGLAIVAVITFVLG